MPIPVNEDGKLRIFFTNRDSFGRSKPFLVDLNPVTLKPVSAAAPVELFLGDFGTFDEDGVMPSSIINTTEGQYLYYIGWNRGSVTPYRLSIGLALKEPNSQTFKKISVGPVLDRSTSNPFFVTTPHVTFNEFKFVMYFSSGTGWIENEGRRESTYKIMKSESDDGLNWDTFKDIKFNETTEESFARPFSIESHIYLSKRNNIDFRERGKGYRILAYTLSENSEPKRCNLIWKEARNPPSDRAYASVIQINGRRLVFYNGDSFGKNGFHIAQEKIEA